MQLREQKCLWLLLHRSWPGLDSTVNKLQNQNHSDKTGLLLEPREQKLMMKWIVVQVRPVVSLLVVQLVSLDWSTMLQYIQFLPLIAQFGATHFLFQPPPKHRHNWP